MPQPARIAPGGLAFHVLNRGVARMQLLENPADYQAFEQVLHETLDVSLLLIYKYILIINTGTYCCGRSVMVNLRSSCNG
jgi:putative transposase